jgi:trehalose 6-phosphate phosphatase
MSVLTRGLDPPAIDGMALFLDLDGTLAPIAATPDEVFLDSRVLDLLPRLMRSLDGRLAIISGRRLKSLDRILGGRIVAVAGLHGLERRTASNVRIAVPGHPGLLRARKEFQRLADAQPGLLVEDKELGIALHYRKAPEFAKTAREVGRRLAASMSLALQEGDMVVELLTPGQDKGSAVLAFMAEAPFAGAVPVFVGDDLTDEHAFAAVSACGGFGIRVGSSERETKARYRLKDVDAAVVWLQTLTTEPCA